MISALSAQDTRKSAHAGQRAKQSQTPAPQPVSTDDPNGLPAAPDGSNNQQTQTTTNNQQIIVIKEKPWWQKALPWVAAGLVSLGGAVVGLRHLGNNFHETNIKPYLESIKNSESDYYKKVFKPISEIANALDEHEKTSPGDKAILDSLREQLLIRPGIGIGSMHHIILGEESHIKNTHSPLVDHKEVEENIAKLPDALKTKVQGFYDEYKRDNPTAQNSIDDKLPQIKLAAVFKGENDKLEISTDFKAVETGWQVATNKVQGWANKLINRG